MEGTEFTLYKICQERVNELLKIEAWKPYSVNPFSKLPSKILDDLMAYIEKDSISVSVAYPILSSGLLTRLQLTDYELHREQTLFRKIIRANCFKFLRILSWSPSNDIGKHLIEALIRSCPKLEEFHTNQPISLDVFQNCKELRVLSVTHPYQMYYRPSEAYSPVLFLKRMQVVNISELMDSNMMASFLTQCPQLLSLGNIDSLEGLEKVHENMTKKCEKHRIEVSDHFLLNYCVWGKNICDLENLTIANAYLYKCCFPEKIRIAVYMCPFVENLIIYINNVESIAILGNLKRLARLKISFVECAGNYMPHFVALLKIIGPNLKYLGVNSKHSVPADVFCNCCPQLESLYVGGSATASGPVLHHCNAYLKEISMWKIDQSALLFLLASSKRLVKLVIFDAKSLDDSLLYRILKQNSLSHLKMCDISKCSLSEIGYRMFLEKTVALERVKFGPLQTIIDLVVEQLINEMGLTNVKYGKTPANPGFWSGYVL